MCKVKGQVQVTRCKEQEAAGVGLRTSSCLVLGEVAKTVYHHYSATAVVFVVDPSPKLRH